jgi:phospholipid/cholesterol/gamma-HCH transport system permease protein
MKAEMTSTREKDRLVVRLRGSWKNSESLPAAEAIAPGLRSTPAPKRVVFDAAALEDWDSGLLIFVIRLSELAKAADVALDRDGLPPGARRLLALAGAAPPRKGSSRHTEIAPLLDRLGGAALDFWNGGREMLDFIGDVCLALGRLCLGRARLRAVDLLEALEQCGVAALPIVSLISVLVGVILAFIGALQLRIFGAQIYVASLVGIAMVRALAAVMTGIIMAGRTGASFAAQIGTMQVNEEIDALETFGINPVDFLVLPRMLALSLMMPLLSLYANVMGILGGFLVAVTMLDVGAHEYFIKTRESVSLRDLGVGFFSAAVFGALVSIFGCMRGMRCGRSASAVGDATTSAVVSGIVGIVVSTAIITLICSVLHL